MEKSLVAKKRDVALDCLKAFAIFLVLWGHCIQYFSSTHYAEQPMFRIIYSFHMPLFMALVGYFASSLLNYKSFFTVFWKKFKQLIIPAIVFITILSATNIYNTKDIIHGIKHVVINLWFLKSAFICTMLFYISAVNKKYRLAGIIVSLILSQFIILWYFQINIMYPCFILGYVLHHYRKAIEVRAKYIIAISGSIFLTMVIFWSAWFWEVTPLTLDVHSSDFIIYWYKTLYRIILGISGTILFFTLFVTLVDKVIPYKIKAHMQSLGSITLGIYLVQSLIIEVILAGLIKLDNVEQTLFNMVLTPLFAIILVFICVSVVKILQLSKITSRLFLGK